MGAEAIQKRCCIEARVIKELLIQHPSSTVSKNVNANWSHLKRRNSQQMLLDRVLSLYFD